MKIAGKCDDVKVLTKQEFDEHMKTLLSHVNDPETGKYRSGDTAIVGSAWDKDEKSEIIPASKCTTIEFDRETKWWHDGEMMLLSDGKTYAAIYSEALLAETRFFSGEIEGDDKFTYMGVGN